MKLQFTQFSTFFTLALLLTPTSALAQGPIAQSAYLKASNPQPTAIFGGAVAVSGDRMVVGAYREKSDAIGVGGDPHNTNAHAAGAAYVFVRSGGLWIQEAYLKPSNTRTNNHFGWSVAISGDRIVIGSPGEDSASTGVNGNDQSLDAFNSGSAYVFAWTGTTWVQEAYLKASNTGPDDRFGSSVAIWENLIAIGASQEASLATGVNGNQGNNSAPEAGAAYVFERSAGVWNQQAYLKASNTDPGDLFGTQVAVSGDRIVVTSPRERGASRTINGDETNNQAIMAGAAYVFSRNAGTWSQSAYLKPHNMDPNDSFGSSLCIAGNRVLVGAPGEASGRLAINGQGNGVIQSGAAYLFEFGAGLWTQQAFFKATDLGRHDLFGTSVSMSNDRILVGAPNEDGNSTGISGNAFNNDKAATGAAYLFELTSGSWTQHAYLKAATTDEGDNFGFSVALSGDDALVGARLEASGSPGVNGDASNNQIPMSGAAYIFDLGLPIANFCNAMAPNSDGNLASISGSSDLAVADNRFSLKAHDLPLNRVAYFLSSTGQSVIVAPGASQGSLCLGGSAGILRHNRASEIRNSGSNGTVSLQLDFNNLPAGQTMLAGDTWNFQCWYRDQNPGPTSNFTGGLSVRFQ